MVKKTLRELELEDKLKGEIINYPELLPIIILN